MWKTVTVGTDQAGIGVLLANEQAERTAGYVVAVETDVDEVYAVFPWNKSYCIAILLEKHTPLWANFSRVNQTTRIHNSTFQTIVHHYLWRTVI